MSAYTLSPETELLAQAITQKSETVIGSPLFNQLSEIITQKGEALTELALWIKNQQIEIETMDQEIRLRKAKQTEILAGVEKLKDLLLKIGGTDLEVKDPRVNLYTRPYQRVEVDENHQLPPDYIKQIVKFQPLKAKIKEALEKGELSPDLGAELITQFHLLVQ